jgi:hypothetical protein
MPAMFTPITLVIATPARALTRIAYELDLARRGNASGSDWTHRGSPALLTERRRAGVKGRGNHC